jgi:flavin-dependent dehydrogenase
MGCGGVAPFARRAPSAGVAGRDAFDVAVIGGGPAGTAIARALARRGAHVALVERTRLEATRVGESLAPAVQPLLAELGLWQAFLALGPLPSFGTRSHWGGDEPRVHSHLMNPWGNGWHVDRLAFDRMLAEAAGQAGVVPFVGESPATWEPSPDGWRLGLRAEAPDGRPGRERVLSSRMLIDATGRPARCASRLGACRVPFDRLVGVTVRFDGVTVDRERYVLVETTADGWWYSAPLPGGGMIAMLMTDGDLCRRPQATSPAVWAERMGTAPATRARLAGARPMTAPRVVAAASHRLRRSERTRPWLAIGDAALAVDPISGSGVVRALKTARAGAEAALAWLETRSADVIACYEADRDLECTRYLGERAAYYDLEQRFSDHPFWARRVAALSAARAAR